MSSWRVSQHYGFGAARLPIQPQAHQAARLSLREGIAELSAELLEGGSVAMLRRVAGQAPAMLLGLLLMVSFVVTLSRDHSDFSPIEVVFFETMPVAPTVLPEPIPEGVVVVEPKPVDRVVSKPSPPPQVLVERPKPAPPVKRRSTPQPLMPQIARVENRPPPPASRSARSDPSRLASLAKPRLTLDAVAPRPARSPRLAPSRTEPHVATTRVVRPQTPRLAAPNLSLPSEAPPPRGFRVAAASTATPARRPQAMPRLAATRRHVSAPASPTSSRVRVDASQPTRRARSVSPALAAAPALVVPQQVEPAARRDSRPAAVVRARREPLPAASMARVPAGLVPSAITAARIAREEASLPQGEFVSDPGLVGVPLGKLSACVSDREEDRLKQAVVAAVTTQKECASRAGTYRFVETKNLNSFLMWIDQPSDRAVGDRCDELRHALQCLQGAGQHAAR